MNAGERQAAIVVELKNLDDLVAGMSKAELRGAIACTLGNQAGRAMSADHALFVAVTSRLIQPLTSESDPTSHDACGALMACVNRIVKARAPRG